MRMKINYNECLTFHVPMCNFASIKCISKRTSGPPHISFHCLFHHRTKMSEWRIFTLEKKKFQKEEMNEMKFL